MVDDAGAVDDGVVDKTVLVDFAVVVVADVVTETDTDLLTEVEPDVEEPDVEDDPETEELSALQLAGPVGSVRRGRR